jgi:hypothetical protein
MLDNILFILGIKSYDVSFPFVSKKDLFVDEKSIFPYEKFKLLYKLKLIKYSENENEDEFNIGILPKISLKPNTFDKFFYAFYTLYFLAVSVLLWTQCVYNFGSWIYTNDIRHLVSFFTHINVPIIHIWSKRYFMSNHMEKILNRKKFKTIIISLFTLFSILANFVDTPAFNNHYMWPIVITNNDLQ